MILAEPIAVTLEVTAVLDELGLRYVVGGSIASSLHGVPRSTNDIDLVVALAGKHVDDLVTRLASSFYIDKDMILDAVRRRSSFNIIHLATGSGFDGESACTPAIPPVERFGFVFMAFV
jgi:hypothetical protein